MIILWKICLVIWGILLLLDIYEYTIKKETMVPTFRVILAEACLVCAYILLIGK